MRSNKKAKELWKRHRRWGVSDSEFEWAKKELAGEVNYESLTVEEVRHRMRLAEIVYVAAGARLRVLNQSIVPNIFLCVVFGELVAMVFEFMVGAR